MVISEQKANIICDGNVGIGTSSPSYKLDVTGQVRATSGFIGDVTGNASTATNVAYSGLTGTVPTWNQNTSGSSGSCTGNASTATKISAITNGNIVQLTAAQTLTNKTLTSFTGGSSSTITTPTTSGTLALTSQLPSGNQIIDWTAANAGTIHSTNINISGVSVNDSTSNTNFPIVFHNESNGLLDDTGAFVYNPSTGRLGIGTSSPDYKLSVENGGIFLQNNDGNFSANYRKSITNTVGENEIHGNGGGSKGADVGFLRLSAGGGTSTSNKSYIDLYGYDSNIITFGTRGAEKMVIDNTGNVGIGTDSPGAKLEIKQAPSTDANTSPFLRLMPTDIPTHDPKEYVGLFMGTSTTSNYGFSLSAIKTDSHAANMALDIRCHNNSSSGTSRLLIDKDGNVGIGTDSPTNPLQIGDNNVNMTVQAASGMVINGTLNNSFESDHPSRTVANNGNAPILIVAAGTNASNNLSFGVGGSNYGHRVWIQGYYDNGSGGNGTKDILLQPDGGNVGIGVTSPSYKLHVTGQVRATSGFIGDVTGNASTATNVAYTGLTGTVPTWNQNTSGVAAKATILETARTIGGVSFNGSANINLPGVNTTGNQNTSGSSGSCTGNAATSTLASTVTFTGNTSNSEYYVPFVGQSGSTGTLYYNSTASNSIYFNPSTGRLGIGTSSPGEKLEVDGNIRCTGNLLMGGYASDGTPSKIHIGGSNSDIPSSSSDSALLRVGGDHDLNGTLFKLDDYNNDSNTAENRLV